MWSKLSDSESFVKAMAIQVIDVGAIELFLNMLEIGTNDVLLGYHLKVPTCNTARHGTLRLNCFEVQQMIL